MVVRLCDCCKKQITEKEELSFFVEKEKYRVAVLHVKIQNGVRWKEADFCRECIDTKLHEVVVDKIIDPELCVSCVNNINPATRFCKMGIMKSKRKRRCKYKHIKSECGSNNADR